MKEGMSSTEERRILKEYFEEIDQRISLAVSEADQRIWIIFPLLIINNMSCYHKLQIYTFFLKESHLVPIYFALGQESNTIAYLVSWTKWFHKFSYFMVTS